VAPKDFVSGGQRLLFRSKYDSSYATFTPTLAYLWYLVDPSPPQPEERTAGRMMLIDEIEHNPVRI
jgi:hypothetical protein